MNEVGHKYLTDEDLIPEVKVDAVLNLEEITRPLYNQIALLEPFGAENPVPSFLSQGVQLQEIKFMGKEKNHVRFRAKQGKGKIEGVGFGLADIFSYIDPATDLFDVVYELDLNTWNGREKLQMKLLDIRHNTSTSG